MIAELFAHARFLPLSGSQAAGPLDALSIALVLVAGVFTLGIFVLLVVFSWRYRSRPGNEIAQAVKTNYRLEIAWTLVPLLITLGAFAWGANQYLDFVTPPKDPLRVYVVGKQWMWEMEYQNGAREINELHVPVDQDVELTMISQDVIHSFFIPDFRMKFDVLPGRYTRSWFHASKTGDYRILCTQYCGTDHSVMIGTVHVLSREDFDRWRINLAQENRGELLFAKNNCVACHESNQSLKNFGPRLEGVFGRNVTLTDGSSVRADETYLRESILAPGAKLVAGYGPSMPPYVGLLSESEVVDLIVYLKSKAARD